MSASIRKVKSTDNLYDLVLIRISLPPHNIMVLYANIRINKYCFNSGTDNNFIVRYPVCDRII